MSIDDFVALFDIILLMRDYLTLNFSLFELWIEQSRVSQSSLRSGTSGFVAFSGILVLLKIKKNDKPFTLYIFTHISFENCLDLCSSGWVLYTYQAYDRIHIMILQSSDHPQMNT